MNCTIFFIHSICHIAIRIKCSGYDPEKITVKPDLDDAMDEFFKNVGQKFAIANYTAIQPTRAAIKRYKERSGGNG